jgi:hypothetical protein
VKYCEEHKSERMVDRCAALELKPDVKYVLEHGRIARQIGLDSLVKRQCVDE